MATSKETIVVSNNDACLSHDELMLKELERRDGIYSFIFHELETPKNPTIITTAAVTTTTSCIKHTAHSTAAQQQLQLYAMKPNGMSPARAATAAPLSREPIATTGIIAATNTSNISAHTPLPRLPASSCSSSLLTPKHYHEYLKTWQPPASFVYDHPKLYAYMANCGFRVRVPTPRFSHVTVPLVRNRRHALKDSPDYKRCEMYLFKIPDLRQLFPNDPDVHAPFVGNTSTMITTNASTCLVDDFKEQNTPLLD